MADSSTLSTNLAVTNPRTSVYNDAREVKFRARVTRPSDSPAQVRAFDRLTKTLESGEPLSREVPRGYYINILV